MSGFWVDVVPFQHGYEDASLQCWALVQFTERACQRRACERSLWWGPAHLCTQHLAQADREGVHIVRLPIPLLQRLLDEAGNSTVPPSVGAGPGNGVPG